MQAPLEVDGKVWQMTCVSMGNPHAVTFGTADGESIKATISSGLGRRLCSCTCIGACQACHAAQVDELDIYQLGPKFEKNAVFPARTNTEFIEVGGFICSHISSCLALARRLHSDFPSGDQVLSREHVRMLVWERGAGRTLACGTGACAVVVAGVLEGRLERNCRSAMPIKTPL